MFNLVMREQKLQQSEDNGQEREERVRVACRTAGTLPGGSPSAPSPHAFSWSTPIFPRKLDRVCVVCSQESQHVLKHFFLHVFTQLQFLLDYFGLFYFFSNEIFKLSYRKIFEKFNKNQTERAHYFHSVVFKLILYLKTLNIYGRRFPNFLQ